MKPRIDGDEGRYLDSLYQGEILDNDIAFAALVEGLRARGRLEDTLVLFTADHGEEFLDHGGKGHGHTLYQELVRVPLAVRLPGARRAGTRDAAPIAQVDLLPTLASLASARAPAGVEGRDLSARWLGAAPPPQEEPPELVAETRFGKSEKTSLRLGPLKYIDNDDPRRYGKGGGPPELFDLGLDPRERRNLAHSDPIAAGYLAGRLQALLKAQQEARRARKTRAEVELTEEDKEQLRALGYVQ
jgi:arylsulfatase A-like enzyme